MIKDYADVIEQQRASHQKWIVPHNGQVVYLYVSEERFLHLFTQPFGVWERHLRLSQPDDDAWTSHMLVEGHLFNTDEQVTQGRGRHFVMMDLLIYNKHPCLLPYHVRRQMLYEVLKESDTVQDFTFELCPVIDTVNVPKTLHDLQGLLKAHVKFKLQMCAMTLIDKHAITKYHVRLESHVDDDASKPVCKEVIHVGENLWRHDQGYLLISSLEKLTALRVRSRAHGPGPVRVRCSWNSRYALWQLLDLEPDRSLKRSGVSELHR